MRILVALLAAAAGVACVFAGLLAARAERDNGPAPVVNEFVEAFLAGDRTTMQRLLADGSQADLSQLSAESLTGVTFRITDTKRDGDRATSKVTFVSPGDFLRGNVFSVRTGTSWKIEAIVINDRRNQRDTNAAYEELNQIPGVDVSTF